MNAYQRLVKMERYTTRRGKVFAKRARRLGWSAEDIISTLKYGVRYFAYQPRTLRRAITKG